MALTVTATQGGTTNAGMAVSVLLYSNAASPAAQAAGGKTGSVSLGAAGATQLAITPNATGSRIVGAMTNGVQTLFTANAASTMLANSDSAIPSAWGTCKSSAATTSGTPVTIGASAPTTGQGQIALAEILASGGTLTENTGGEPAVATSTTLTALTTASFTPNPGDLLVLAVTTASGNSGSTTLTITNSGGLTFTSLVSIAGSFFGCNAIYVAQMPGGASSAGALPQPGGQQWRRRFRRRQIQPLAPSVPPPVPGVAALQGTGSLTANGEQDTAAGLDAAGTLAANGEQDTTAALDGAGSLLTGPTQSAPAGLDAAGSLIAGPTQSAPAALDAAGSLLATGSAGVSAALDAAGSVIAGSAQSDIAALHGTGSLITGPSLSAPATIDGTGSLITGATEQPGPVALDGIASLAAGSTIAPAEALDGAGSLLTGATEQPGPVALDAVGSIIAAGLASATATIDAAGSLIAGGTLIVPFDIVAAPWVGSSTTTRTNTVTSASFTPVGGSLLVALTGCGNENGVAQTGITVSDSVGGTWTQLVRKTVSGSGDASVWVKDAGASPSAQTVTVTMAPGTVLDVGVAVRQCLSALPAAQQTGVTANSSGTVSTVSLTPGTTNSQIMGAWGNGTATVTTANAATTFYGQTNDSGGSSEGAFEASALSVATVAQVLGYTATQAGTVFAAAEILPGVARAAVQGTGSLLTAATIAPVAGIDAAGSLLTAATIAPGASLTGTAALAVKATQGAPTALQGTGSLSSVGYSVNASLFGTGTLATAVILNSGAALDATGTLSEDVTLNSSAALTGTGTLPAAPGTVGGTALDAAGTLSTQDVQNVTTALTGTGSLTPKVTQAPGVALDGAGTVAAVGFAIGAALAGTGSVIASSTIRPVTLLSGTGSIATAAVQSPALEAFNFGTFPQIPNGSAITSVTVVINEWASTSAMNAATFELWDGTSARIGSTQIGTPSTSPYNLDSATFTGVTYSQLATLRVRIYANAGSSAQGDQELANSVSLTVAFTPSTNAAATVAVLKEATVFPAVTAVGQHNATATPGDSIPTFTSFPAVTAGQLSINGLPVILRAATVFPPVTASGVVNASITVSTLALAGTVVASIVTATSTGPDYAKSADIAAGTGTSVGTWTSVAGVIGPPDASEAVWTRP